jgi:serine/threonine protein phosphatase 1
LLYAVGDIHGRLDLLQILIGKIREDIATSGPLGRLPVIAFLGDYVDRGPASQGVIEEILALKEDSSLKVVAIRGNHDQYVLDFFADPTIGPDWLDYGGGITLASYGVMPPASRTDAPAWEAASALLAKTIPPDHREFLESSILVATFGDYVLVHAGVRPAVLF